MKPNPQSLVSSSAFIYHAPLRMRLPTAIRSGQDHATGNGTSTLI